MLCLTLVTSEASSLRPPALAASGEMFAALIEDVISASRRSGGEEAEEQAWMDRRLRWQAAAIPLRMARHLSSTHLSPDQADILIGLQLDTLDRILREEPGRASMQPSLERLRQFLREGRPLEHVEAAIETTQHSYRRQYSAFRLSHRRWRMRQDFEAGRPWSHR